MNGNHNSSLYNPLWDIEDTLSKLKLQYIKL